MRVGELSRRSGVGVSMIKYYLREGMLPPGERAGAPNQATYGSEHLRRLRLLRALTEDGALSAAAIKQVLAAVDGDLPLAAALGVAQDAVVTVPPDDVDPDDPRQRIVADLVHRRGWRVDAANPGWPSAIRILGTADRLGFDHLVALLEVYADAADTVARHEVAAFVDDDREGSVETAVTGIVLGEALFSALRTMAHQHATLLRLGAPPPVGPGDEPP